MKNALLNIGLDCLLQTGLQHIPVMHYQILRVGQASSRFDLCPWTTGTSSMSGGSDNDLMPAAVHVEHVLKKPSGISVILRSRSATPLSKMPTTLTTAAAKEPSRPLPSSVNSSPRQTRRFRRQGGTNDDFRRIHAHCR